MPTNMMSGPTHWMRQGQQRLNLDQGRRDVIRRDIGRRDIGRRDGRDGKGEEMIQARTYGMTRAVVTYHCMLRMI